MIYIEQQIELDNLCIKLGVETKIGVDFEFIRESSLIPKLCLIQIATEKEIYIIDPLNLDLKNLLNIFTNPEILKIFHACNQDLDVLYKNFLVIIKPIFDIQIAAAFLGYGSNIAYAKLTHQITHNTMDKSSSLTNWQLRPLSREQLIYATNDVKYLFALYQSLTNKLTDLKRLDWCIEEHEVLYDKRHYEINSSKAWKKIKHNSRTPFFLNYLRALAKYRQELAIQKNILPKHVIKDEIIIKLAYLKPQKEQDIKQDRILTKLLSVKSLANIIKVCKEASQETTELLPADSIKLSPENEIIADIIKIYLKHLSYKEKIASKYIATSYEITQFLQQKNLNKIRFLSSWRHEYFGRNIKDMINGKIAIKIIDNNVAFIPTNNNPAS
jgi:ribonuclease D